MLQPVDIRHRRDLDWRHVRVACVEDGGQMLHADRRGSAARGRSASRSRPIRIAVDDGFDDQRFERVRKRGITDCQSFFFNVKVACQLGMGFSCEEV
jgi:hypothetical protein